MNLPNRLGVTRRHHTWPITVADHSGPSRPSVKAIASRLQQMRGRLGVRGVFNRVGRAGIVLDTNR